ncbi:MAG: hypothetical protein QM774_05535 [Gordonia sp. (in: high G+C Gram-positive bacteria)]|uniref:hypothetical protein n=1 Tax=Gordonia sp. (in: high G+C Gram-positive bacteria) TaxID=84139 RepID=UPI0039E21C8A
MVRALGVAATLLILAVAAGAAWALFAPRPDVVVSGGDAGIPMASVDRIYSGVAVYAVIAAVLGILVALVVWFGMPRTRGPLSVLYTVAAALAGGGIAMAAGTGLAKLRVPELNPHKDGTYPSVIDLWLKNASLANQPAPWLLLVIAPGLAALTCFFLATASNSQDLGVGDGDPADDGFAPIPVTAEGAT